MKKLLLILITGIMIVPVLAQNDDLNSKVKDAFYKNYPKAENVNAYSEGEHYIIEFDQSEKTYTAVYGKDGSWIETAKTVEDSELPEQVSKALNQKYPDISISYAEFIENAKGETFYRLNCYTGEDDYIININLKGEFLNTEKMSNSNESIEG